MEQPPTGMRERLAGCGKTIFARENFEGPHVCLRRAQSSGTSPVCLVHLVYLVSLVQPNRRDRPNKPNEQDWLADFFSILLEQASVGHRASEGCPHASRRHSTVGMLTSGGLPLTLTHIPTPHCAFIATVCAAAVSAPGLVPGPDAPYEAVQLQTGFV